MTLTTFPTSAAVCSSANSTLHEYSPTAPFCVLYNGDNGDLDEPLAPPPYALDREYKRRRLIARLRGNSVYRPAAYRSINTMHKRVADKIHPVNADVSMTDGSKAPSNVR
jgi:hypothetical protein